MFRDTRRVIAVVLVTALFACQSAPALLASERRLGGSVIEMHQRSGRFIDPSNNNQSGIKDRPVFILRKGDTVSVVVVDQNPLLFTYGAELTTEETEQHKAAVEFAKTLVKLLDAFKSVKGAGPTREVEVEGLNLKKFRDELGLVQNNILSLPSKLAQSVGTESDIALMKADVAGWDVAKHADEIAKGYDKVATIAAKCLSGQLLTTNTGERIPCAAPAEPTQAAAAMAADDAQRGDTAVGGPFDAGNGQAPITNAQPPKPIVPPVTVTPAQQPQPQPPTSNVAPLAAAPVETIQAFVTLAIAMQSKVESSLTLLKAFATDVGAVGTPRPLPPSKDKDRVDYSLDNQTFTVTVGQNSKYDDFMGVAVKKARADGVGKYPIELKPYTPATIGVAPAFVVLFGKNPTFKAVKSGDEYEIQSEDPQGVGYNVAAMLTLTPRAWAEPTFGGHVQIGVSPTKDKIGIYLGAGISVQQVFTFGLGASWQQVNKLANGLQVGQKIASADLLKTGTEYKPGLYFHITTTLPTGK